MVEPLEPLSLDEQAVKIKQLVTAYFAEHPRAMDTVAGIMEWWIQDRISANPETVKRVLDGMTRQGSLERIGTGDYAHYRLRNDASS